MKVIDLIRKLEILRLSYGDRWIMQNGEPEIMIDSFRMVDQKRMLCSYEGFDENIEIVKSDDGEYNILSGFGKNDEEPKSEVTEIPQKQAVPTNPIAAALSGKNPMGGML